jgi:hypothetical protein
MPERVEQYEASMSNATSLLVRIREMVKDEKCNDENLKEKVMGRLSDATGEFKTYIDQEV